jgi:D-3-phosphoglycerate dehydrogenase
VETIALAFGMNVIWWASEQGRERLRADNKNTAESRKAFFNSSDIVSVHIRMKPETTGIITALDLSMMSKDALFVNTSRAGLIAKGARLDALNLGRPGMAAIEVFDNVPIRHRSDPLACHPQLIGTPHIGFVTVDEFEIQFADIFDQIIAFDQGSPIHMINPRVWQNISRHRI